MMSFINLATYEWIVKKRCFGTGDALYEEYHDKEWGKPVHNDRAHFEFILLEGAQAGLSWSTILKRRKGYKKAFANFDAKKVAKFTAKQQQKLLKDEGIIRNRLNIKSAVQNAQAFLAIQKEFGSFDKYIWSFTKGKVIKWKSKKTPAATTPLSDEISKDLKNRGFNFVGSTIIYAYLQAVGIVNDHFGDCYLRMP